MSNPLYIIFYEPKDSQSQFPEGWDHKETLFDEDVINKRTVVSRFRLDPDGSVVRYNEHGEEIPVSPSP